ncbi:MAG: DUF3592 domain-containing protein [Puniceicoccales bacterium]|jgi:hypothetical protein|nr:DUF3592 domain-containing protein [Puniceicoccales bacterium]
MPGIAFILFISVFYAVGIGILGYGVYMLYQSQTASRWPTVEGKILECNVIESHRSGHSRGTTHTYEAKVRYSYVVAGTQLEGSRIAFGYSGSSGEHVHNEIADRLRTSRAVMVRYDPNNPSRSVLSYGINRSTITSLVFGVMWLLVIIGFSAVCVLGSQSDKGILNTLITIQ